MAEDLFIIGLIAHADALDPVVMDTEQRSAADHIIAPILAKGFQRCRDLRELLQFVKEKQRFPGDEFLGGVKQRDVLHDALHIIALLGDRLIFWLQRKVDLYDAFVSPHREPPDRLRFSDLPRALHDQRLPLRVSFPRLQKGINFPFQIHTAPPCFWYGHYTSLEPPRSSKKSRNLSDFLKCISRNLSEINCISTRILTIIPCFSVWPLSDMHGGRTVFRQYVLFPAHAFG